MSNFCLTNLKRILKLPKKSKFFKNVPEKVEIVLNLPGKIEIIRNFAWKTLPGLVTNGWKKSSVTHAPRRLWMLKTADDIEMCRL